MKSRELRRASSLPFMKRFMELFAGFLSAASPLLQERRVRPGACRQELQLIIYPTCLSLLPDYPVLPRHIHNFPLQ